MASTIVLITPTLAGTTPVEKVMESMPRERGLTIYSSAIVPCPSVEARLESTEETVLLLVRQAST